MKSAADQYFTNAKQWKEEMSLLREILLECELEETIKWSIPCYVFNNKNIVVIQAFKTHCDLGFFNGILLKDEKKILIKVGEHTQAGRQLQFKQPKEIVQLKSVIKSYVKEAIALEKAGVKFEPAKNSETIELPELDELFKKDAVLKKSFEALTPGRQRGYLLFFSAAKQSATRVNRIQANAAKIKSGKGMHDCTCGLSKRMPNCDGSHKYLKQS
jgi:uncharacterized protein YdeI (YjbR/CyaY-like superfamily)